MQEITSLLLIIAAAFSQREYSISVNDLKSVKVERLSSICSALFIPLKIVIIFLWLATKPIAHEAGLLSGFNDLRNIVSAHKWDFAQIQMNYLDWENQNAKMQYQILEDAGIPTIVMEPVRGGKLALVNDEISDMFKSLKPDNSP